MDAHIHSNFSDGEPGPMEIVSKAVDLGLNAVAVVDHVRSDSDWLDKFAEEVRKARAKFSDRITVLCGIEAKCLDLQGNLDLPSQARDIVDFVAGAIHRIPTEKGYIGSSEIALGKGEAIMYWAKAAKAMLANPALDLWVHPGRMLEQKGLELPREVAHEVASVAQARRKFVERNVKFSLPRGNLLDALEENEVMLVPGSDAHSLHEMDEYSSKCSCGDGILSGFLETIHRMQIPRY